MAERDKCRAAGDEDTREVMDSIRRIVQALRVSSREAELKLELSGAQLFVLQRLADGDAMSINELADRTFTHQSSVSVVVQRLVERKLVERQKSKEDGRRMELALTAAGRQVLRRAPRVAQDALVEALDAMGAKERRALAASLQRLVEDAGIVGKAGEAPQMFFEDRQLGMLGGKKRGKADDAS